MHDDDIIDVEVVSETRYEPQKPTKATKPLDDHSKAIRFYGSLARTFMRFGESAFFLSAMFGLIFSILYQQSGQVSYLVLMAIGWSVCGLSLIAFVLGIIFHRITMRLMAKDPNYEHLVQ